MYLTIDVANVYRGAVRDHMVAAHATAGFNGGVFMGRRGALTAERVRERLNAAEPLRHGVVDILEQSFINFCVDTVPLSKLDANELVTDYVVAGALMRLIRDHDGLASCSRIRAFRRAAGG